MNFITQILSIENLSIFVACVLMTVTGVALFLAGFAWKVLANQDAKLRNFRKMVAKNHSESLAKLSSHIRTNADKFSEIIRLVTTEQEAYQRDLTKVDTTLTNNLIAIDTRLNSLEMKALTSSGKLAKGPDSLVKRKVGRPRKNPIK